MGTFNLIGMFHNTSISYTLLRYLWRSYIGEIFDPFVREIEKLVKCQLDGVSRSGYMAKASTKPENKRFRLNVYQAIALVGGFGSSEYLFQRLKMINSNVLVIQPPNA